KAAGRKPAAEKNAPRPLDLDLLLYGKERIATRRLTVPHPRMANRLFVLVPLADVAPRHVVPGTGKTVARLLAEARRGSTETVRRERKASVVRAGARSAARERTGEASSG
ncbi:MAG: 2-amino-4-hydroxy-6-hydroxymethyldihydropteridine diphosphokinase, partial [Acidobacteriota bacterium]